MQSLNEEMQTVNAELRSKMEELSRSNSDMKNLLDSTEIATIFLDNDFRVNRFTPEATKIVNLVASDVGRPLGHFTTNLKYDGIVKDAKEVLRTLVPKDMELEAEDADASRLQQVFWNLLKNAIKFTPHGGWVGIRCQPDGDYVLIEVSDSGIGVEPESLSRIFIAFEQADRSTARQFGGLGLGLAISKTLVEMHNGTISVHSEGRDKGAAFRVRLPLCAPADQAEESAPPRQRALRPLHVLLVEDHGVTAKLMRMVLASDGHTVERAGDVATALELADRHRFDLLVSDLGLPDGSGHDLMRQLRQRGHTFPGIALSGYGQSEDIQRSREAGFAAHLTKPASRHAVIEAVASVTAGESGGTRRP